MKSRMTIRLPGGLLERAKRKAAAEGRTLTALIEEGLHMVLAQGAASRTKPILPRVSKATGGPMPGIDLDRSSVLQELDDLEYVERMKHMK